MDSVSTKKPFKILHNLRGSSPLLFVRVDQAKEVEDVLKKEGVEFVRETRPLMAQGKNVFYILNLRDLENANRAKQALDEAG